MTVLRRKCLWEHLTPPRPAAAKLAGEVGVDVCVIGAGITGLSAAVHLLEMGRSVCVVEAHDTGHGGSGRNVGLVNAGTWIPPDDVEKALPEKVGARLNATLGEAPALVFATIDRLGIDCQATRTGTLQMAHNARGAENLRSRHEQWRRRGARVELLEGKKNEDYCGTKKVTASLLDHRAGTINPMAYTSGLAAAVVRLGGHLYHHSPVNAIERSGSRWLVRTPGGAVLADKVVIGSNAYTEGDWTEIRKNFFAGYYYQIASTPLASAAAASVLPYGQGSWDTRTVLSSIRRDAQGRLVLGSMGDGEAMAGGFLTNWADRIQRHYFPQLGRVSWEFAWTGRIAFTPDHLMRLFEPAPGLVAVTGYNGRGVTTGTVVGKAFARYLVSDDRETLPLPFAPLQTLRTAGVRSLFYEVGFRLYHAGQCLRIIL